MQQDPSEDALKQFASNVSNNGVIVPVEPSDLKSVWKVGEEMREQRGEQLGSNQYIAIDPRSFATVCSPGANVMAVWCRVSMLGLLAQSAGLFPPEMPDEAKDVIFNVFAKFPIKLMEPGVVYQGFPMDVQEFMRQVEDELRRLGFKI